MNTYSVRQTPEKCTKPPDEIDHNKSRARDTVNGDSLKEFCSIFLNIPQGLSIDQSVVVFAIGSTNDTVLAACHAALQLFDTSLMNILALPLHSPPSLGFEFVITLARPLECAVGIQ